MDEFVLLVAGNCYKMTSLGFGNFFGLLPAYSSGCKYSLIEMIISSAFFGPYFFSYYDRGLLLRLGPSGACAFFMLVLYNLPFALTLQFIIFFAGRPK